MTSLEQLITKTLSYFDIFEYPLTLWELKKNLLNLTSEKISLSELEQALNNDQLKNLIDQKNGFYFLAGREKNYYTRQKRYLIAETKFKRAKKINRLLGFIPYIKMIAVCNSLGYSNASAGSDIDFFIVAKKNHLWTTRLLSVLLVKFLNLRPKPGNAKDKICLSFFISENNLNLEKFQIISPLAPTDRWRLINKNKSYSSEAEFDIYLIYWTTQLIPLLDRDNTYNKFWQVNSWVENYLPNRAKYQPNSRRQITTTQPPQPLLDEGGDYKKTSLNTIDTINTKRNLKKALPAKRGIKSFPSSQEGLGEVRVPPNWLEKLTKKIQLTLLNPQLKNLANKDTRVVINDDVLKLYPLDRRADYLKRWQEKINSLI